MYFGYHQYNDMLFVLPVGERSRTVGLPVVDLPVRTIAS
jgi:hypothetical protein